MVAAPPRLFGVDAARGLALVGMFVAHTVLVPGETLADGRSAILFATLAGVSLGLMTGGSHPPPPGSRATPRLVVLVRAAVLVVLGLALTAFVNPPIAVILDAYGVGYLLLLAPLFLPRAALAALALVVALAAPPVVAAISQAVPFDDVPEPIQPLAFWLIYGYYPMLTWTAFLLAGLLLARAGLGRRPTALVALLFGVSAALLGYGSQLVPGVTAEAHSGTTAEVLGSGGLAVAVIGLLSLLDSATGAGERVARGLRFALAPLAAAGSMPLTLYTAQAIVLGLVRATAGGGRYATPDWVLPALIVGSLLFATLWRRFVGTGPLELGMRALTRLVVRPPSAPRVAP